MFLECFCRIDMTTITDFFVSFFQVSHYKEHLMVRIIDAFNLLRPCEYANICFMNTCMCYQNGIRLG